MQRPAVVLLACLIGSSAVLAQGAPSFEGKTVTLIISSAPGGGTDTFARVLAPFMEKYLPGSPHVMVRNLPGAGGITAMNYMVQQVPPDGLTFVTAGNTMADPMSYRKQQSHFNPGEFGIIGGAGRGGEVLLISKNAEKRLTDKSAAPVVMGSLGGVPRSGMQMTAWGIEYLGWNAKWVIGYRGTNELMLALERGEIDMTATGNIFHIDKMVGTGRFKVLVQSGALRNGEIGPRPDFGDAPVMGKLLEGRIGDELARKAFLYWSSIAVTDKWSALPPKTPQAFVETYRTAYARIMQDADFIERGKKTSEDFVPMTSGDVEHLIRQLSTLPPEATDYMTVLLRKQGLQPQ